MEYEIDISMLWSIAKKCWLWVLLAAVLVGGVFGVLAETMLEDRYSSSVTFYVVNFQDGVEYSQSAVIMASQYLVKDYMELITSDLVLEEVAVRLYEDHGLIYSVGELADMIKTEAKDTTSLFTVNVTGNDRLNAKWVADAIEEVAPEKIDSITQKDNAVDAVIHAKLPQKRVFPNVNMIAFIAAFLSAVLMYALFLIRNLSSTKIYTESDVAKVYAGPVIGLIPMLDKKRG